MAKIEKGESDFGIRETLYEISTFSKNEKEIRSLKKGSMGEKKAEEKFDLLINNLMALKTKIKNPQKMPRVATSEIDEKMIDKVTKALKFFETPAKIKQREEKMRILQGTLFWEKLFGFQTLLENLQDERLKPGRKVEKISETENKKK